jgi:DNA-binding LacI/PurR family transcriptional regulator
LQKRSITKQGEKMENYKKAIEEARKEKINKRFGNTSIEHAKILTNEILLDAKHTVKILSDNFNNYFYSKIIENIKNFLKKDKKNVIEIITNKNEKKSNKLIKNLKEEFPTQIKVYYIDNKNFPIDSETGERVNFIINDNNAYRYEYSDAEIDNGIVKAIANFNNSEENQILNEIFEKIKKRENIQK